MPLAKQLAATGAAGPRPDPTGAAGNGKPATCAVANRNLSSLRWRRR